MNWVITVNEVSGYGNTHIFSTAYICNYSVACGVYDRILSVYPPPDYDVVMTKWSQNVELEVHSYGDYNEESDS